MGTLVLLLFLISPFLYPPSPLSLSLSLPPSSVALWNNSKKKPQVLKSSSHEAADVWITAVTALPYSDLVASGEFCCYSHDTYYID